VRIPDGVRNNKDAESEASAYGGVYHITPSALLLEINSIFEKFAFIVGALLNAPTTVCGLVKCRPRNVMMRFKDKHF